MKKGFEHVLPRPVEKLPDYAHGKTRKTLAERLVSAFGLSHEATVAISNGVVDPSAVRKGIGEPTDPKVEEISVPGGTLLGIRTPVWARRIMPDPRNPRIGPSRRHPFAVDPGTAGEDSRYRPVPEPRSPAPDAPELVVGIESRHQLTWAAAQAAKYVLAENNWSLSIKSQGVMEAVWLVATTYMQGDGTEPVTTLTTVEGSSRTTAVHDLLEIRSADVPYDDQDQKLRAHLKRLNEAMDRGATEQELVALRCERVPALVIVGFRKHHVGATTFPTAVKSLVALRHVDPPKPWGDGPENESLADEVLDELYRKDLISDVERAYYSASCTKAEARAAHLSDEPAHRAARIVSLLTSDDERVQEAIRIAVTSQSTRKRISAKLLNELATALILRAHVGEDAAKTDRVRRYMRHSFGKAVHKEKWESTARDVDGLFKEAMREVKQAIGDESITEPGPASLELAVRAAYPLVVTNRLNADRGSANNDQPDRRNPGEVLDAMRRSVQGVFQLAQAIRDFKQESQIRAVDEHGKIRKLSDGDGDQMVSDVYLRDQFPPPGKVRAPRAGDTPTELLQGLLAGLSDAISNLEEAHRGVSEFMADDGQPLIDSTGADPQLCADWRGIIGNIDDDLTVWGRKFRQVYGTTPEPTDDSEFDDDLDSVEESEAEIDGVYADSYDSWEDSEEEAADKS